MDAFLKPQQKKANDIKKVEKKVEEEKIDVSLQLKDLLPEGDISLSQQSHNGWAQQQHQQPLTQRLTQQSQASNMSYPGDDAAIERNKKRVEK